MEENWKPIAGFEGLYEVSDTAKVRSVDHQVPCKNRWGQDATRLYRGRELKPYLSEGYLTVDLAREGRITKRRIHRLMAEAFLSGGTADMEVNHINENRLDNRLKNLEWVTHRQNAIHGTAIERGKQNRPILGEKPVRQLTMEGRLVKKHPSLKAAARAVSGDPTCIQRVCDGQSKHHHGYRWKWD